MTDNTTMQSNTIIQAGVIKTPKEKKCPTCGNAYNNNSTTCPNEVHRVAKEEV